jgi:SAM-dependent methyltransferase
VRPDTAQFLAEHSPVLSCPKCGSKLSVSGEELKCDGCAQRYPVANEIPQLFWPNEWDSSTRDVTEVVKAFYEISPFPNYDEVDDIPSLIDKACQGVFARLLDEQIPIGARVLECGCGTGQLSNFLSIYGRTVFATDICLNSLRLGQDFKDRNRLRSVHFFQMNLFRPVFRPATFDLVICNGVLHHTADPFLGFKSIGNLVKPNGFIVIGLYHRYGRLITNMRRLVFRLFRDRFTFLDPNLRGRTRDAKRRAWFMDQYKHPHESRHTIGEVLRWLDDAGFSFVKSIPRSRPGEPFSESEQLFRAEQPGTPIERLKVELGMILSGSREGGFFTMIGRRR